MALNTSRCNHLTPLRFKGLKYRRKRGMKARLSLNQLSAEIFGAPTHIVP